MEIPRQTSALSVATACLVLPVKVTLIKALAFFIKETKSATISLCILQTSSRNKCFTPEAVNACKYSSKSKLSDSVVLQ
ncbi:hypothetical protein [Ruminococcus bicirculans (ex Wegman et al. 2014)]|uniref:hypothetical protein n=1 Tax=Ruminococcus bicirculans (ex Wegman et al. 2014) TaxID=1160721 RepID=UPI003FEDA72B